MTNDLVSFSVPDIVFTWINLLIIFLIVKKFLFGPIREIIAKRQKEITEAYSKSAATNKRAEALKAEYEKLLAEARQEATELVKKATETATAKADVIIEQAKSKAMEILEKAQAQIRQEKDESLRKAFGEVSNVVLLTTSKLLEKEMNMEDHKELIGKIISEIGAGAR